MERMQRFLAGISRQKPHREHGNNRKVGVQGVIHPTLTPSIPLRIVGWKNAASNVAQTGLLAMQGRDGACDGIARHPRYDVVITTHARSSSMSEHTYKMIELVGSSHVGIEEAVKNAVAKAAIDEKSLRWLEVLETRGHIEDGKIAHWQVRVKIGATLD